MKSVLLAIGVLLSSNVAHAAPLDWQDQLAQFKQDMQQASTEKVWLDHYVYATATVVTCSVDAALAAAVFVAQTTPIVNGAVQIIATYPHFEQDLANLTFWDALANSTRGVAGGTVAVTDTLQFIYLWLAGDTSQSYQQLAATYAATIATADALFAQQGECMMNTAKTVITAAELQSRNAALPMPADVPASLSRP